MGPALNGSSALQGFKRNNAVEICIGIMFDFYPGLPQVNPAVDYKVFIRMTVFCHMGFVCQSAVTVKFSRPTIYQVYHEVVFNHETTYILHTLTFHRPTQPV